jgi:hypothetical protein
MGRLERYHLVNNNSKGVKCLGAIISPSPSLKPFSSKAVVQGPMYRHALTD